MPAQSATLHTPIPPRYQFAAVDADHVILETVKQAEGGDGWIVRLYENQQRRRQGVTITFGTPLARAAACNLLEEPIEDQTLHSEGNCVTFAIEPFEIKSFRVWFAADDASSFDDARHSTMPRHSERSRRISRLKIGA